MIRMGVDGGLIASLVCLDGQKYTGPQSVCVETAVWQRRKTAGGEGAAAGDRNCFPPHQTPYLGGGSFRKGVTRETIKP